MCTVQLRKEADTADGLFAIQLEEVLGKASPTMDPAIHQKVNTLLDSFKEVFSEFLPGQRPSWTVDHKLSHHEPSRKTIYPLSYQELDALKMRLRGYLEKA